MFGAVAALEVDGLGEFQRALSRIDKVAARELKEEFRAAAEPVRVAAEGLAREKITRMTIPWSRMRVGITRDFVYIAPSLRGVRERSNPKNRPNLVGLMLDRAMEPALAANESHLIAAAERALEKVGVEWQRAA